MYFKSYLGIVFGWVEGTASTQDTYHRPPGLLKVLITDQFKSCLPFLLYDMSCTFEFDIILFILFKPNDLL